METFDRPYGATLAKCLSALARQSNQSGALRLSQQRERLAPLTSEERGRGQRSRAQAATATGRDRLSGPSQSAIARPRGHSSRACGSGTGGV